MAHTVEKIYRKKEDISEKSYSVSAKATNNLLQSINNYNINNKCNFLYFSDEHLKSSGLTLNELFEKWLITIEGNTKESTIANYYMKFRKHICPAFGGLDYRSLTSFMVYRFIQSKIDSGLSARYVSDIIILLKAIFKYALDEYGIFSPVLNVKLPKKRSAPTQMLNFKEQQILKEYLQKELSLTSLGVSLSLNTGIRIGELCALRWIDIDLDGRMLTVNNTIQRICCSDNTRKTKIIITEPKSESSHRIIPIPNQIMPLLKYFCSNDEYFVLSNGLCPVEPRTMQYRFKAILKRAGLPQVNFHSLRHMFATNCINKGFDIKSLSEILGHSSVELTLNRYVHPSFKQKCDFMYDFS